MHPGSPTTHGTEAVAPSQPLVSRLWFVALIVILIVVVLAAGLTALGYGPLASRFKSLRSSGSAPQAITRGAA